MKKKGSSGIILCISVALLVAASGCTTLNNIHQRVKARHHEHHAKHPHLIHRHHPVEIGQIRTGGLLNDPGVLEFVPGHAISLRQAVLESGGIRREQDLTLVQQSPPVEQARPATAELDTTSLKPVFDEQANIEQLFNVDTDFFEYEPPVANDSENYLRFAVMQLRRAIAFSEPAIDTERLQYDNQDSNQLLDNLIFAFEAYKQNNPQFADNAINLFRKLKTQAILRRSVSASNSTPSVVRTESRYQKVLIGLVRSRDEGRTYYFHPELIFKTAIGMMDLRNGDFVFAIEAADTTLLQKYELADSFLVPVVGVSERFNSVDYADYRTLSEVYELYDRSIAERGLIASVENVAVLDRTASGVSSSEVFYIPMGADEANVPIGKEFVEKGRLRPGDSLVFTYASRSPLILRELLNSASSQQHNLGQRHPKLGEMKNSAVGKNLSKAARDLQYYVSPITPSVKSLLP